jgi:2-amino-4-hydroxy-6-hydroxymethyldihydropteridine diphosphokinase
VTNEHTLYLSLGSNISPEENLNRAIKLLQQHSMIEAISSTWESAAIGSQGPNFLNLVASVRSSLPADEFKEQIIRRIEAQLGRVRSQDKNAPRPIDIDILIADGQIIDKQIWERAHLAVPLSELKQDLTDPNSGIQIRSIAKQLSSIQSIKLRPDVTNKFSRG